MSTTILNSLSAVRFPTVWGAFERAWTTLLTYRNRARERARLRELPPHLLADIGVNQEQACAESRKPFWVA